MDCSGWIRREVRRRTGETPVRLPMTKLYGENNGRWKGGPVKILCAACGQEFTVTRARLRQAERKGVKALHCSHACCDRRGEKNSCWRGGRTPANHIIRGSVEYREWRETVFARDNWTCQDCGDNKGRNLHAHHIFPFSQFGEHRFDIWNGVTLCMDCHQKCHPNIPISGKAK